MKCPFYEGVCKESACNGETEFIADSGKMQCNLYVDNEPTLWRTDLMPPEHPITRNKGLELRLA